MQQLRIRQEIKDDILVMSLWGQLDAITSEVFTVALAKADVDSMKFIVLDMGDITLVDSSGIGVIVELLKKTRTRGGDTVIAEVGFQPMEVFKILNLNKHIKIFRKVREAIKDCKEREA